MILPKHEDEEEDREAREEREKAVKEEHVSIALPMFIWLFLLAIGLLIRALLVLANPLNPQTILYTVFNGVSNFILLLPGAIILPVIVGAVIGAEIGRRVKSHSDAIRVGVLTGIYACIIYLVALLVIYTILFYTLAGSQPSYDFVVRYWLEIPVAALLGLTVVFALLSYSRKMS